VRLKYSSCKNVSIYISATFLSLIIAAGIELFGRHYDIVNFLTQGNKV